MERWRLNKTIPFHVAVNPPEGNLRLKSFVKREDVRSISRDRFMESWGTVTLETLRQVEDRLRILMDL